MAYKRILTIQDISCVGQCSLTVALPVLSAAGHETAVLPSAVLSTHTAPGFGDFTFRDLTDDIPLIAAHWKKQKITFDAVYTGYLGSAKQIRYVKDLLDTFSGKEMTVFVDPAMADDGVLYTGLDEGYVKEMRSLAAAADLILPNITEACLLTGIRYRETYEENYIDELLRGLMGLGAKNIILTGVSYSEDSTGIAVLEEGRRSCYTHRKLKRSSHGTGDVFASAFVGAYMRGRSAYDAAKIAADYTLKCIENTADDPSHWYGVKFEPVLPYYIGSLQ